MNEVFVDFNNEDLKRSYYNMMESKNFDLSGLKDKFQTFVDDYNFEDQTNLVNKCLESNIFDHEQIKTNLEKYEQKEINQWVLVDNFFSYALAIQGETIIKNDFGNWWGRDSSVEIIHEHAIWRIFSMRFFA